MFLLVIFYFLLVLNDSCNKLDICVKEPVKGPCLVAFKMQLHIAIYLVKITPIISTEYSIVGGEIYSRE